MTTTCRVRLRPNIFAFHALTIQLEYLEGGETFKKLAEDVNDPYFWYISNDFKRSDMVSTGSVAEFYIVPLQPILGDIDTMFYSSNMVVVPYFTYAKTTYKLDLFQGDHIVWLETVSDERPPGFALLRICGRFTWSETEERFVYGADGGHAYLVNEMLRWDVAPPNARHVTDGSYDTVMHGPATKLKN